MENNSTLERLLRIQGNPKQMAIETATEEARAHEPAPPVPPVSDRKLSPEEREAWSALYRLYEKYALRLRAAARMDEDTIAQVFGEALQDLNELYQNRGLIGAVLACPLYDLLGDVLKAARNHP